jgi:hypothetical protein
MRRSRADGRLVLVPCGCLRERLGTPAIELEQASAPSTLRLARWTTCERAGHRSTDACSAGALGAANGRVRIVGGRPCREGPGSVIIRR